MERSTAQRRLVKSPPELWAEVSDEEALRRRLEQFGEIRITRVEPETTVAWEGDRASGTVRLAATGWGTQVTLTATPAAVSAPKDEPELERAVPALELEPPPMPDPDPEPEPEPAARGGLFARLFRRRGRPVHLGASAPAAQAPLPAPHAAALSAPAAPGLSAERTAAILGEMLDDLGAAHHRPFSRD